ncbi:hypothetical protein Syun_021735 [Stephania yunnanensis]|uniref:Uncharacterized protein n=1 Tax=Stephania yunnanensis TaxID=152371 RepID=A0AAP0NQ02_9MAGN
MAPTLHRLMILVLILITTASHIRVLSSVDAIRVARKPDPIRVNNNNRGSSLLNGSHSDVMKKSKTGFEYESKRRVPSCPDPLHNK